MYGALMNSKKLVIVGAGGFCREVINWAIDALANGGAPIRGYLVDPHFERLSENYGLPWISGLDDYQPQPGDACLLAVSDPTIKREMVMRLLERGATFTSLVHPTAVVAKTASVGFGAIICPFGLISADVVIEDYVTVNSMSSIGHDSRIGSYSTLSGHVDITGGVIVGESVFFGSGARVLPKLKIGDNSKIGAGAVIVRSVIAGSTMYTTPAKKLL